MFKYMFILCIYEHNTLECIHVYVYMCVLAYIVCIYVYTIFFKKLATRRGDMTCIF